MIVATASPDSNGVYLHPNAMVHFNNWFGFKRREWNREYDKKQISRRLR